MRLSLISVVTIAIWGFSFLVVSEGRAQSPNECLSKYTKFDVCAAAQELQSHMAQSLPLRMNSEMSIISAFATGSRVGMMAIWDLTQMDLQARLIANKMTQEQLIAAVEKHTQNIMCSQESTAAFIRLGGQLQFKYQTTDGFAIASPLVVACP